MKKEKLMLCLKLFLTFFKIGAFTFGGGYAMIPLIQRETAEKNSWISKRDILDIVAVAESTPGPIAINSATFVGYQTAGVFGAFCATLGVVLPSFIIIYIIASFLRNFYEITAVKYAFFGIRAGVLSLMISSVFKMSKQIPKNLFSLIVAIIAFILVAFIKISVLWVIILSGITGIIFTLLKRGEIK